MIEQYFMLIVSLNFLIAIISQVFESDLAMSLSNNYTQKCEMNVDADYFLRFFKLRENDELFILVGSKKDSIENETDDLRGMVSAIKSEFKNEVKELRTEIKDINSKMDIMMEMMRKK